MKYFRALPAYNSFRQAVQEALLAHLNPRRGIPLLWWGIFFSLANRWLWRAQRLRIPESNNFWIFDFWVPRFLARFFGGLIVLAFGIRGAKNELWTLIPKEKVEGHPVVEVNRENIKLHLIARVIHRISLIRAAFAVWILFVLRATHIAHTPWIPGKKWRRPVMTPHTL